MKNRISKILQEKGIKKSVFADLTGIARQNVNLILSQRQRSISYKNIQKICEVLDIEPNELFDLQRYDDYIVVDATQSKVWSIDECRTNKEPLVMKLQKKEAKALSEVLNKEVGKNNCIVLPEVYLSTVAMMAENHKSTPLVRKYYPALLNLWKFNRMAGTEKTVIKGSVNDFQSWFLDDGVGDMDNSQFRCNVLNTAIANLEQEYSVKCTLETMKDGHKAVGYRLEIKEKAE